MDPTIGIVTALPEEHAAMYAMLGSPRTHWVRDDPARYVMGTVASTTTEIPHTVVLTLMVEPGNNAAATAGTNLIRSFRSVNCVLMVGTAAGVPNLSDPSKHVRLGDVVVASWGMIDYDHVDETVDGPRLRGGHPQPYAVLKVAANGLREREMRGERPWEAWLDVCSRAWPAGCRRPPDHTDVLYDDGEPGIRLAHPDRSDSGHRRGKPKIHYGLIGSADRSWRNTTVRDVLAARFDLRALEMEGTGIGRSSSLNGIHWFAVRGISDYGNHASTAEWRSYASLAAAAYVRALLAEYPPHEERGGHIREVLSESAPALPATRAPRGAAVDELHTLARALYEIPQLRAAESRSSVIRQVEQHIGDNLRVERSKIDLIDIHRFVERCFDFPCGPQALADVLRFNEGDSVPLRRAIEILMSTAVRRGFAEPSPSSPDHGEGIIVHGEGAVTVISPGVPSRDTEGRDVKQGRSNTGDT